MKLLSVALFVLFSVLFVAFFTWGYYNWAILAITFAAISGIYIPARYTLGYVIFQMALNETLFFAPRAGEIMAVMDSNTLAWFHMEVPGKKFGDQWNIVDGQQERSWLNKTFGVEWLGFPPRNIFIYGFRWFKVIQGDKKTHRFELHDKNVNSIFYHYPYGLEIRDLETIERLFVSARFVVWVEVTNPQKALFGNSGSRAAGIWVTNVLAAVESAIRDWVGNKTYDELIRAKNETAPDGFVQEIQKVNAPHTVGGNEPIGEMYGAIVRTIHFLDVELSDPELRKMSTRKFQAEQEAAAAKIGVETAQHLSDADKKRAEGNQALGMAPYNVILKSMEELIKMGMSQSEIITAFTEIKRAEATEKFSGSTLVNPSGGEMRQTIVSLPLPAPENKLKPADSSGTAGTQSTGS